MFSTTEFNALGASEQRQELAKYLTGGTGFSTELRTLKTPQRIIVFEQLAWHGPDSAMAQAVKLIALNAGKARGYEETRQTCDNCGAFAVLSHNSDYGGALCGTCDTLSWKSDNEGETKAEFERQQAAIYKRHEEGTKAAQADDTEEDQDASELAALLSKIAAKGKGSVNTDEVITIVNNVLASDKADRASEQVEQAKAINDIIKASIKTAMDNHKEPTRILVAREGVKYEGTAGQVCHERYPKLLAMAQLRKADGSNLNICLDGPAGTGKTTAAKHIARDLDLPFHMNGAITSGYQLTGFTDAQGRVIDTQFKKAWTTGGVYLFDEVDGSSASAVLEFNGALANGACAFPEGLLVKHEDCIIIAATNAFNGPTAEFNARQKLDDAFRDRFVYFSFPIDEALETATASNPKWCLHVQAVRKAVKARGIKGRTITPRATYDGETILSSEHLTWQDAEEGTLSKGMAAATWTQIQADVKAGA